MTDDEKVQKMFDIRFSEMPGYEDSAERIRKILFNRTYTAYNALLKMYNERFG